MRDASESEATLLRAAYAAFNARDREAALAAMTDDVTLPNGMDGGYIHGREAVRAYWERQWAVIHPHDEPLAFCREGPGCVVVDVHQVVRDLSGAVLSDQNLRHRCTLERGLIKSMELC